MCNFELKSVRLNVKHSLAKINAVIFQNLDCLTPPSQEAVLEHQMRIFIEAYGSSATT